MLYFFHGRIAAVLAHGLVKEGEVPQRDIELAIRRKLNFERDPDRHAYKEWKSWQKQRGKRQRMPLKFSTVAIMQASRGDSRLWSKRDRTITSLVS